MKKVIYCLLTFFLLSSLSVLGAVSVSYNSTTNVITISGTGAMEDYNSFTGSVSPKRPTAWTGATSVVIEEGVTYIGTYAFHNCSSITSVTIPVSVKGFGHDAFSGCSNQKIYYAGTPNEWADIDFEPTGNYAYSHPFNGGSAESHYFYFYGQKTTENKVIVFHEGLETIKPYTFYFAGRITDVCIPNSVTSIGSKAFTYCKNLNSITVLSLTAPDAPQDAFDHIGGTNSCLFLPAGADASASAPGFRRKPWYDNSDARQGAAYIGYNSTDVSATSTGNNFGFGMVYPLSGTINGISWSLSLDGVLTLEGNGILPSDFTGAAWTSSTILPWARFRRMINSVVIISDGGDITSLGNALQYCFSIEDIHIEQQTIPTSSYVATNGTTSYTGLFDQRGFVYLHVGMSSFLLSDETDKLDAAPWNDPKVKVVLEDKLYIDENSSDNMELLEAVRAYIDMPFTMQLQRSVSNAYYNTFCSPIDLTAEQVEATFGAGTLIHELASTTYDAGANELTLNFADSQDFMDAGVPYLLWPANNVVNPVFNNVDPASVADAEGAVNASHVIFHGTLEPRDVTAAEIAAENFIFLQADNHLNWANSGTLKGMRAYWLLKEGVPAHALARRPVMRIGSAATRIGEVPDNNEQCTKVLRDGQVIIIRGGKEYNIMGISL